MNTILFISEPAPHRAILAAAWAKFLKAPVRAAVASSSGDNNQDQALKQAMGEIGLEWPREILALASVDFFAYDLVVSFSTSRKAYYPALPGNPAIIHWQVPDPATDADGQFSVGGWRTLRTQIYQLVKDLFQQSYFSALVQARRNAELVLDNLHEGVIAHDMERRIFFFNKKAEEITGFSRQEIIGHDCHAIFTEGFCGNKCAFCDNRPDPSLPERPYSIAITTKRQEVRQLEMSVMPIRNFLNTTIGVVASFRDMTRELELAQRLGEVDHFDGIIGRDSKMQELYRTIRDLAESQAAVLIQGESGTGKELVAAAIHNNGKRTEKLFVPVNCGALPENLLEARGSRKRAGQRYRGQRH